ncbi:endoplasmic reticulum membrane-associated RNA degradation protein-like isoform X2 [Lytechinus pictus]|uniref:endoplasmic reticulum membrane-associated RNA degradation protein-like isoform X2 n=1 Tax=Lytechinus pictus TaxID=7653 RepID=UPI0030BA13F9
MSVNSNEASLLIQDDVNIVQDTYLSPSVYHLICEIGTRTSSSGKPCLLDNGLIDWDSVNRLALQDGIDSWETKKDFIDIVSKLTPLCLDIHEHVMALSLYDLQETYSEWFEWTGSPEVFLEGLRLLKEGDMRGPSISLLMTTSALERALGDVYLMKNKPCPSLLKDLLITEELQSFFGCHALFCLRVLIGPPTSLNLRNILWHGFASPGEIPSRYASFLLVVAADLGYKLHNQGINSSSIPHRKQIEFQNYLPLLHDKFPVLFPDHLNSLSKEVQRIGLFCDNHISLWDEALNYYSIQRYNHCIMIICPLLEHLIRLIFAKANQCPERVLTAESTVLFTTFDEMICVELSDGAPNLLIPTISEPFMNLLMDLLVHPDGPRLRDRISHGEVDHHGLPQELASIAICTLLACSTKLEKSSFEKCQKLSILDQILDSASSYTSVFHPLATCRRLVRSLAPCLSDWSSMPRPSPQDLDYSQWQTGLVECDSDARTRDKELVLIVLRYDQCFSKDDEDFIVNCVINPFLSMDPLAHHIDSLNLQTLFRPRKELERTSLLQRIAVECLKVNDQIQCLATTRFSQWQSKELRSRQRSNYQRFLNSIYGLEIGVLRKGWSRPRVSCCKPEEIIFFL